MFSTDSEDYDDEPYDDGRAGAAEMFSTDSEDYDDEPYGDGRAGAAAGDERGGSPTASAPAKGILSVEGTANQATLRVDRFNRGLLSDMIHAEDALGLPVNPEDVTTIAITATTGPVWARAFSNLRGGNPDPYGADGPGVVPEDEYQSARFSPPFRELVDWWHKLGLTRQKTELAKISETTNWEGIPGIFSKKLKGVLTAKKKEPKKLAAVRNMLTEAGLEFPTPVEISDIELERIMRDAIRRKVTSEQFKAQIKSHLVGDKLPYWVAERGTRGTPSKWTLPKDFPRDFLRSQKDSA
jgi:hypothetical protein